MGDDAGCKHVDHARFINDDNVDSESAHDLSDSRGLNGNPVLVNVRPQTFAEFIDEPNEPVADSNARSTTSVSKSLQRPPDPAPDRAKFVRGAQSQCHLSVRPFCVSTSHTMVSVHYRCYSRHDCSDLLGLLSRHHSQASDRWRSDAVRDGQRHQRALLLSHGYAARFALRGDASSSVDLTLRFIDHVLIFMASPSVTLMLFLMHALCTSQC